MVVFGSRKNLNLARDSNNLEGDDSHFVLPKVSYEVASNYLHVVRLFAASDPTDGSGCDARRRL